MEVLTAYVRQNTLQASGPSKGSSDADEAVEQPARSEAIRPTADIQAILDVLGRAQTCAPEEHRTRLDLHEAYLQGADLQKAYLQEAYLQRANLQGAYLYGANLRGASVNDEQLAATLLLQGATMPDGSQHP